MSNGCAVELTQGCTVSVDYWNRRQKFQACFLTHAHTDHTHGLSDRWPGPDIHCTEQTKRFILNKWPRLEEKIVTVEVGDAFDLCLTSSSEERLCVTVTPIDARHCPGSVMFLFEGSFGRILHTGDFRWELRDGVLDVPDVLLNGGIDRLYLDNTYCNPEYKFPPRVSEMKRIVDIVKQNPEFKVVIGMDSLGKEEIVEEVSRVAEVAVGVSEARVGALRIAGIPEDCFTTDMENARITVIPKWTVRQDDLASTTPPSIGIVPSALFNQAFRHPTKVPTHSWRKQQLRVTVPYSLHCCFSEIEAFVSALRPRKIIGIVKQSRGANIDPLAHFQHLLSAAENLPDAVSQSVNQFGRASGGEQAEGGASKCTKLDNERNPSHVRRHSSEPIPKTVMHPPTCQERPIPGTHPPQEDGHLIDLTASPVRDQRSEKSDRQDAVGVRRTVSSEGAMGWAVGTVESGENRGVKMGGAGVVSRRSWRTRFTRPQRTALKIVPQGCTSKGSSNRDQIAEGVAGKGVGHDDIAKQESVSAGKVGVVEEKEEDTGSIREEKEKEEEEEEEEEIVPNPHKVVWSAMGNRKYCKDAINVEC